MKDDISALSFPVQEIIEHLHNQGLSLPPSFNEKFIPMVRGMDFTTTGIYNCELSEDGVLNRAKWISSGFGYAVYIVDKEDDEKVEIVMDIFGPKRIMLHEDGFFNGKPAIYVYKLTKGTTVVPFARERFAELAALVPEAKELAVKILSNQHEQDRAMMGILKMQAATQEDALKQHFGKDITEYFSKKSLAQFLGRAPETMSRRR